MKLKTFYGLLFISFLALPVCGMEKRTKLSKLLKKITKSEVRLQEVTLLLDTLINLFDQTQTDSDNTIEAATARRVQRNIQDYKKRLNEENISSQELIQLRDNIEQTTFNLEQSIEQNKLAQELKHLKTASLALKNQIYESETAAQQRPSQTNTPIKQMPVLQNQPTPQERPKSVLFAAPQIEPEDTLDEQIKKISQHKKSFIPNWKKGMAYLMGTGLFTALGIYSWRNLSPDTWYRPVAVGISALGSGVCSFYSYKNLRMHTIQY